MPTAEVVETVITREELVELKSKIFKIIIEMGLDKVRESDIILLRELSKDTETLKALRL
jgi:hypothetical protein